MIEVKKAIKAGQITDGVFLVDPEQGFNNIDDWVAKMKETGTHIDEYFLLGAAQTLCADIVVLPLHAGDNNLCRIIPGIG